MDSVGSQVAVMNAGLNWSDSFIIGSSANIIKVLSGPSTISGGTKKNRNFTKLFFAEVYMFNTHFENYNTMTIDTLNMYSDSLSTFINHSPLTIVNANNIFDSISKFINKNDIIINTPATSVVFHSLENWQTITIQNGRNFTSAINRQVV